jgi:hypothetical protein
VYMYSLIKSNVFTKRKKNKKDQIYNNIRPDNFIGNDLK